MDGPTTMNRKVARIPCPVCGAKTDLRQSKKGLLYLTCGEPDCGHQLFSRSRATDRRLAAKAEDWTDGTLRAELGAIARPPSPSPAPKPGDDPPPPPKAVPWWDRPLT